MARLLTLIFTNLRVYRTTARLRNKKVKVISLEKVNKENKEIIIFLDFSYIFKK